MKEEIVGSDVTEEGRVFQMAGDERMKVLSAKTVWVGKGVRRFLP